MMGKEWISPNWLGASVKARVEPHLSSCNDNFNKDLSEVQAYDALPFHL